MTIQVVDPPDSRGRFGEFGGRFVPETLIPALTQLEEVFTERWSDSGFRTELSGLLTHYAGRPTPLTRCENLSRQLGSAAIFLKREDLAHTGSHKINNCLGQALLAREMGKERLIAETGAGQHGVATATVAALFGMECVVYMGAEDIRRQALNVFRMRLLGAEVREVRSGSMTLKDATNEALRDWVASVESTHYVIGSVVGPHPYPLMVREFQSVIGAEARQQFENEVGTHPDYVVACVGGGSNAIGIFSGFRDLESTRLVGVEAAGEGLESGRHGASLTRGEPGVLHGALSLLLQDEFGQVQEAHSISAGLDYPGVGPEHAAYKASGRATYEVATDSEALGALQTLTRTEGILPALESAHALAWVIRTAPTLESGTTILVNLSGRGDKDVHTVARAMGEHLEGGGVTRGPGR